MINAEIKEENLHLGIKFLGDPFVRNTLLFSSNDTGCILFICSYAVAIVRYVITAGTSSYFIFDSHCKNSSGITNSQLGFP